MFNKDDWPIAEQFAVDHMRHLGFKDAKLTPAGADGGIDVESATAVAQVKHWKNSVTRPDVQRLNGAAPANTSRLFYAASGFTRDARLFADEQKIALFEYDLDSRDVNPVSTTAIRLDAALTSPIPVARQRTAAGNHAAAAAPPRPVPGYYSSPPPVHRPNPHPRAVQATQSSRPLRWYFYLAGFTVSGFAWIAFLHAYMKTSDPRWRTAAIVFGIWCPVLYSLVGAFSTPDQSTPPGDRELNPAQSIVTGAALAAAIGACLLLTVARNEVLDPTLRRAPKPPRERSDRVSAPIVTAEHPSSARPAAALEPTPTPPTPEPQPRRWRKPGAGLLLSSILWALSPLYTLGLGTPIAFLIAAVRRPTVENFACMTAYLGVIVYWFASTDDTSTTVHMLVNWLGANAHTFLVRRRVWYRRATAADESRAPTTTKTPEPAA
jgi:hypothetical protein